MSTTEDKDKDAERKERDAQRKRLDEKAHRREARTKRVKDIAVGAIFSSIITIIVVTSLGWLTTQSVVEKARAEGMKELVDLRASICLIRFQQRPDAEARLVAFKALSWNERQIETRKFVADEGLATMLGEDEPAPGAVDKCADAIKNS